MLALSTASYWVMLLIWEHGVTYQTHTRITTYERCVEKLLDWDWQTEIIRITGKPEKGPPVFVGCVRADIETGDFSSGIYRKFKDERGRWQKERVHP